MTLLGILFVVGVAFLATMNFEADMISAEKLRTQSESGVDAAVADAGTILRNAILASPGVPFGDSSLALSGSSFAELPGIQNSSSAIEPYFVSIAPGSDGVLHSPDDDRRLAWGSFFDAQAYSSGTFRGPSMPGPFAIDTTLPNGAVADRMYIQIPDAPIATEITLGRCRSGVDDGLACDPTNPCTPPGQCEYARVADADGDGIVDSLLVDAKLMGLSDAQVAEIGTRVNPASNPNGTVSVALRVVPHGGMVNLNDAHPKMIETVFDLPYWPMQGDPVDANLGNFVHAPTQRAERYSSVTEEPLLRRRNNIPPRDFQPSMLHGNPVPGSTNNPDMAWMLFWRDWAKGGYQDVFSVSGAAQKGHRSMPFAPDEFVAAVPNVPYWQAMMDPDTATSESPPLPWNPTGTGSSYDRRHLVTTASHDDLLARTVVVKTARGEEDVRRTMIEANWTNYDPDMCMPLLPFEYVNYPTTIDDELGRKNYDKERYCCPDDPKCKPASSKGRLQLSLPWIDEQLQIIATDTSYSPTQQIEFQERIQRTIHDVFYMLVRNASRGAEVEGMSCEIDGDCPIIDTVCRLDGNLPAAGAKGVCVHENHPNLAMFSEDNPPTGPGCLSTPCGIPRSMCRDDGVCVLAPAAWSDMECTFDADPRCQPGEFCLINPGAAVGLCADRWTRMRRSEYLAAKTAASLTANLLDFVDQDNTPSRIAIRNFEFVNKCTGGGNHNLPCDDPSDCPSGACLNLAGRDVDTDPTTVGVQGVYVYGLERQPYITEVATLAALPNYDLVGRAVELVNPYASPLTLTGDYFLVLAPGGTANLNTLARIPLNGAMPANDPSSATGPFVTLVTAVDPGNRDALLDPKVGTINEFNGMDFENGWTIYLVRQVQYPTDAKPTDIVVDQIVVGEPGDGIGLQKDDLLALAPACIGNMEPCRFSVQRVVPNAGAIWTAPVPDSAQLAEGEASLGTWNTRQNNAIHPVDVNFANTGLFGWDPQSTFLPSFPSTGSMLLLMRHANSSTVAYNPPTAPTGTNAQINALAFTTSLIGGPTTSVIVRDPNTNTFQTIPTAFKTESQIDNGRMPLFDIGENFGVAGIQSMHRLQPRLFKPWDPTGALANRTTKRLPGDLNTLPWGQLIFDYFTALPLNNPGPYFPADPNMVGAPESLPRVDQGGMRVHGRININAAPWKVLSGIPMVPMGRIPVDFRMKIAQDVFGLNISDPVQMAEARPIGTELAKAIAAYRDARAIVEAPPSNSGTGDYDTGLQAPDMPPGSVNYGRGWTHLSPSARRGTGFMSVGELANVRHTGASQTLVGSPYRSDAGELESDPNKNNVDFVRAAATLIALGDWVTVRSHVFTVYGMIRGADDDTIADPLQKRQDTDTRAIRFQETIDRFPVLEGRARPQRIGERTVGSYTDVNND